MSSTSAVPSEGFASPSVQETALAAAMKRALALAARAGGRTSPNPKVGAVALEPGSSRILAEGFHLAPGEVHAEAALLREAAARGVDLHGTTLVCTLEPCTHQGRTPPCAPLVAAAGFERLVIAMRDPNPLVDRRGVELVRAAGTEIVEGVLEPEARRLNEGFLHWIAAGRPFVHLKMAMLEDGTVYRGSGLPPEISGPEAQRLVHYWRHLAPAVLVGAGTLRLDDPQLTVRELPSFAEVEGWQPRRIVVSTRFDLPLTSRALRRSPEGPAPIVIGGDGAPDRELLALERAGVATLQVPMLKEGIDLEAALQALGRLGITEVLVEGGPMLADALLSRGLVNRLSVFLAGGARGAGRADPGIGAGARKWMPPGGLPFTGEGLAQLEVLSLDSDRLVTGLVAASGIRSG